MAAEQLARAGEAVGLGVGEAQLELGRQHQESADVVQAVAAAAGAQVGSARAQLRAVLARQQLEQPAPLASPLAAHPRLAPARPLPGRGR